MHEAKRTIEKKKSTHFLKSTQHFIDHTHFYCVVSQQIEYSPKYAILRYCFDAFECFTQTDSPYWHEHIRVCLLFDHSIDVDVCTWLGVLPLLHFISFGWCLVFFYSAILHQITPSILYARCALFQASMMILHTTTWTFVRFFSIATTAICSVLLRWQCGALNHLTRSKCVCVCVWIVVMGGDTDEMAAQPSMYPISSARRFDSIAHSYKRFNTRLTFFSSPTLASHIFQWDDNFYVATQFKLRLGQF